MRLICSLCIQPSDEDDGIDNMSSEDEEEEARIRARRLKRLRLQQQPQLLVSLPSSVSKSALQQHPSMMRGQQEQPSSIQRSSPPPNPEQQHPGASYPQPGPLPAVQPAASKPPATQGPPMAQPLPMPDQSQTGVPHQTETLAAPNQPSVAAQKLAEAAAAASVAATAKSPRPGPRAHISRKSLKVNLLPPVQSQPPAPTPAAGQHSALVQGDEFAPAPLAGRPLGITSDPAGFSAATRQPPSTQHFEEAPSMQEEEAAFAMAAMAASPPSQRRQAGLSPQQQQQHWDDEQLGGRAAAYWAGQHSPVAGYTSTQSEFDWAQQVPGALTVADWQPEAAWPAQPRVARNQPSASHQQHWGPYQQQPRGPPPTQAALSRQAGPTYAQPYQCPEVAGFHQGTEWQLVPPAAAYQYDPRGRYPPLAAQHSPSQQRAAPLYVPAGRPQNPVLPQAASASSFANRAAQAMQQASMAAWQQPGYRSRAGARGMASANAAGTMQPGASVPRAGTVTPMAEDPRAISIANVMGLAAISFNAGSQQGMKQPSVLPQRPPFVGPRPQQTGAMHSMQPSAAFHPPARPAASLDPMDDFQELFPATRRLTEDHGQAAQAPEQAADLDVAPDSDWLPPVHEVPKEVIPGIGAAEPVPEVHVGQQGTACIKSPRKTGSDADEKTCVTTSGPIKVYMRQSSGEKPSPQQQPLAEEEQVQKCGDGKPKTSNPLTAFIMSMHVQPALASGQAGAAAEAGTCAQQEPMQQSPESVHGSNNTDAAELKRQPAPKERTSAAAMIASMQGAHASITSETALHVETETDKNPAVTEQLAAGHSASKTAIGEGAPESPAAVINSSQIGPGQAVGQGRGFFAAGKRLLRNLMPRATVAPAQQPAAAPTRAKQLDSSVTESMSSLSPAGGAAIAQQPGLPALAAASHPLNAQPQEAVPKAALE